MRAFHGWRSPAATHPRATSEPGRAARARAHAGGLDDDHAGGGRALQRLDLAGRRVAGAGAGAHDPAGAGRDGGIDQRAVRTLVGDHDVHTRQRPEVGVREAALGATRPRGRHVVEDHAPVAVHPAQRPEAPSRNAETRIVSDFVASRAPWIVSSSRTSVPRPARLRRRRDPHGVDQVERAVTGERGGRTHRTR